MPNPPSPTSAATTAEKQVITPAQTLGGPMSHSHVWYIVAIIVAAVLALAAFGYSSILARKESALAERLANAQTQNAQLATDAASLQDALVSAPKPVPYYYTTPTDFPPSGPSALHAIAADGTDTIVATFPDEQFFQVYAEPKRGYDGRIFLKQLFLDSDVPSLRLFAFDTESGDTMTPITLELPFMRQAIFLSPDETTLLALYDNPNDPESIRMGQTVPNLTFWNLLSGESYSPEIPEGARFSDAIDMGGAGGFQAQWVTDRCARAVAYVKKLNEDGFETFPRAYASYDTYCVPSTWPELPAPGSEVL